MPGSKKGDPPELPLRRSTRERKRANFGSDFELEDPEDVQSKPKPSKRAKQSEPTPGTSRENPDDPPLPRLDPDADPVLDPKTVTWPSEPEFWAKPQLPTNHSK